jgi:hypothetical protein
MDTPANTMAYMIAGYAVIFGVMLIYIVSLVVRHRNLRQEEQLLEELQKEEKKAGKP